MGRAERSIHAPQLIYQIDCLPTLGDQGHLQGSQRALKFGNRHLQSACSLDEFGLAMLALLIEQFVEGLMNDWDVLSASAAAISI